MSDRPDRNKCAQLNSAKQDSRIRPKCQFRCTVSRAQLYIPYSFAGAEDKGRRGEAKGGRDRSQVALRRRGNREECEQQAERTPGRAPAARESNYTDAGPASIAATKSLQRSRLVNRSRARRYHLRVSFFPRSIDRPGIKRSAYALLKRVLCNEDGALATAINRCL